MAVKKPDFSGWATKANLVCSDGRTIMPDAFKHQDQVQVPLVWQHDLETPENILGHAILTNKPLGVWCDAYFNDTPRALHSKKMVIHGDIDQLSIRANKLVERAKQVFHGMIREVSLVIAGANEGARIMNIGLEHGDGSFEELDEAIIFTGELIHAESGSEDGPTGEEVWNSMDEKQQGLVHYMIEQALLSSGSVQHSEQTEETNENTEEAGEADENGEQQAETGENADQQVEQTGENTNTNNEDALEHNQEGTEMTRNLFDQSKTTGTAGEGATLTHAQQGEIFASAQSVGSLKKAFAQFFDANKVDGITHGINDIELLFPEARNVSQTPEWDKRRTEWVAGVLNGVRKLPYARIKTMAADITQDEARAKGYIKGNLKKEEWFGLTKRTTTPTTVYKKQKLDRDDIIDITDFDVVVWMKGEMRLMTEEEIATAILIGDSRPIEDPDNPGEPNPDKILDPAGASSGPGIRSILHDHELFVTHIPVEYDGSTTDYRPVVEAIMLGLEFYKGTGTPTLYTTKGRLTRMLLTKDTLNRRIWRTKQELATEMGVDDIVEVEVLDREPDVFGIIVNLSDYAVGTDAGGEMTFFDDFDIDYNQYKYLYETRLSGALTKIKSGVVVDRHDSSDSPVTPNVLAFDPDTNTIDYVAQTGVTWEIDGTPFTTDQVITEDTVVVAVPASGYYFPAGTETETLYEFNPDA